MVRLAVAACTFAVTGTALVPKVTYSMPAFPALRTAAHVATPSERGAPYLYVPNEGENSITEYAFGLGGNVPPVATIAGPATLLSSPVSVARDTVGQTYVGNFGNGNGSNSQTAVAVFPKGATGDTAPSYVLAGNKTGLERMGGLFVDANNILYVTDEYAALRIFAAGASGNTAPMATLAGPDTGLCYVFDVKVDSNGLVYVLSNGCPFPSGGEFGNINVYSALPSGDAAPIRTLSGAHLGDPRGFVLAPNGRLLVEGVSGNAAPTGGGQPYVATFAAGAHGDAAPISRIAGSRTELVRSDDNGLAVDFGAALMYVADDVHDRILVFGVRDSGNVAPRAVLRGRHTALSEPGFLSL
jgi:hypothetical protein